MLDDRFKEYIHDLGVLIKEKARRAKYDFDSTDKKQCTYEMGYLMAYHEVIDLMKQQATVFDISQIDTGLTDIDSEKDLL